MVTNERRTNTFSFRERRWRRTDEIPIDEEPVFDQSMLVLSLGFTNSLFKDKLFSLFRGARTPFSLLWMFPARSENQFSAKNEVRLGNEGRCDWIALLSRDLTTVGLSWSERENKALGV